MTDQLDVDLPDPDRPDATADERADLIIGRLLLDDDPVRRYAVVQALQGGRLREVAAITLRQLREERGTTDDAAAAVGISRQAANELLAKAGAPGAREEASRRESYAYLYGRYLGVIDAIAWSVDGPAQAKAVDRWDVVRPRVIASTATLPPVVRLAKVWLTKIRHGPTKGARDRDLNEAGAALDGWDAMRAPRHLTMQERADAILGYHHERKARRGR